MVSTFNAYTVARLGMFAAQQAMQVTGNNIANINTDGYTRQSLEQNSLSTGGRDLFQSSLMARIGNGVLAPTVSHDRDDYLDIRYRNENTNVGNMEAMQDGLDRIAAILDEVGRGEEGEGVLEGLYNNMVEQMDALANQGAGQDSYDTLFRESVTSFVTQLSRTATNLETLRQAKVTDFETDLQDCNNILNQIRELNTSIQQKNLLGDSALELEDKRNVLLDDLSSYLGIDVSYQTENVGGVDVSKMVVYTSTEPERLLVDGIYVGNLARRNVNLGPYRNSLTGEAEVYATSAEATKVANRLNDELTNKGDSSTVYRVVNAGDGTYTVNGYGTGGNFDLDIEEVKDIHGNTKVVRTRDRGVIKNRDIGAVMDDVLLQPKMFGSEEDAQMYADVLNEDVLGTEFRVVVSESGDITIHEFGTTVYESREEAVFALADLDKDFNKQVNQVTGEVTINDYVVVENGDQFEIHQLDRFYGEVQLGDTELGGALLADREILTEKGVFATEADMARDPDANSKRGIQFYQNALDVLANRFANTLNEANSLPNATIYRDVPTGETDADGNPIVQFLDAEGSVTTDPSKYVLKEEYKNYRGGILISNNADSDQTSGINATNISISKMWSSPRNPTPAPPPPTTSSASGTASASRCTTSPPTTMRCTTTPPTTRNSSPAPSSP